MDPMYLKLAATFFVSTVIFVVMMRIEKRKELDAQKKFEMTLKSRGLKLTVEEQDGSKN